jgi:hypothetical protein
VVVLRFLLYTAVACSIGVYAYRAYRRWLAPHVGSDPTSASTAPANRSGTGGDADADATPPAKRGLGFRDPRALDTGPADGESLVQAVIREEVAKQRGLDPAAIPTAPDPSSPMGGDSSGRSGLFAPSSAPGDRAERVSVAAALTGARLPDDLVPLVDDAAPADPHHVYFHADQTTAADLGRHLADELERLGYTVRSESDRVARATKGTVDLRVTLYPDAGNERLDGRARFPTVGPRSVVVELQT